MDGKELWGAAGLSASQRIWRMIAKKALVAPILVSLGSCGENGGKTSPHDGDRRTSATGANATNASRESSVTMDERQPGNPAERDGVRVYRPKALTNTRYDLNSRSVIDLDTGDKLITKSGHAGGEGTFGLSNEKTGNIAGGLFKFWSTKGVVVYEVRSILTDKDEFRSYRARDDYDISRIAEMFRAKYDKIDPHHEDEVLVVDSRPEKINDIDPQSGARRNE